MISISEFQIKDVVDVSSGKKLGTIGDIDINVTSGKIQAIIIGGTGKMMGIFRKRRGSDCPLAKYSKNWRRCNTCPIVFLIRITPQ
ncbi:hypothetical protein [Bacillus safensis FO-36b] [Bacillus safensis subsp. safensis]